MHCISVELVPGTERIQTTHIEGKKAIHIVIGTVLAVS